MGPLGWLSSLSVCLAFVFMLDAEGRHMSVGPSAPVGISSGNSKNSHLRSLKNLC